MMLRIFVWSTLLLGLSVTVSPAQPPAAAATVDEVTTVQAKPDQPPPPPPETQKPGVRPPTTSPPPDKLANPTDKLAIPPPAAPGVPKMRGRDLNLQVEITISDQLGTQTPDKKVVSMLVADATFGRIRASADAQRTGVGMVGTGLNVDARPTVLNGDRILLELTVEYTPFRESGQITQRPTVLNESLSVILQSGKPMVVSQAADPVADRKIAVEVRASIVK
jgi:hypothetical protein